MLLPLARLPMAGVSEKEHEEEIRVSTGGVAKIVGRELVSVGDQQCGSELMVKSELDAARVLAGLSHLALGNPSRVDIWGQKVGAETRKRQTAEKNEVEEESSRSMIHDADLVQNSPVDHQTHTKGSKYLEEKAAMVRQDPKLPESGLKFSSHASFSRGKSRQNLSEAEKEARRQRRILANRESARQTIRRRQALCEELTKKAADLSWDNESMKQEKQSVMKEYHSLKDRNKLLKALMEKAIKREVEKSPYEAAPTRSDTQASTTTRFSSFTCNDITPYSPFLWPPVYPVQTHLCPKSATELKDSTPKHTWVNPCSNSGGGPTIPVCLLPYPWFFPVPNCGHHTSDPGTSQDREREADSNKGQQVIRPTNMSSFIFKTKTEASNTAICPEEQASMDNNFKETPNSDLAPDKDMTVMASPVWSAPSSLSIKSENSHAAHSNLKVSASSTADTNMETSRETVVNNPGKRLADGVMAAEARKRRKELTKLKPLYTQKFRVRR